MVPIDAHSYAWLKLCNLFLADAQMTYYQLVVINRWKVMKCRIGSIKLKEGTKRSKHPFSGGRHNCSSDVFVTQDLKITSTLIYCDTLEARNPLKNEPQT